MVVHEGLTLKTNLSQAKQVKVTDFVGAGAFGSVWKVKDTSNNNFYALKHIRLKQTNPGQVARYVTKMTEEAKINLPSPYLVKAYGLSALDSEGLDYAILFELVEGVDFDDWIKDNKNASWETKRNIFLKILEGVSVAHNHGIYHKDLKPQNIKIAKNNIPKILDFGLASTRDKNVTQSRELSGTLSYLAPESMCNIKTDEQFDIYSLGCILYDLFRGDNYLKICSYDVPPFANMMNKGKLTNGNILDFDTSFPQYSENDKLISNIIRKSTTFNLEYRYRSINEMLKDFGNNSVDYINYDNIWERFRNHKLEKYDLLAFLIHFPDITGIVIGLILGFIWGWFHLITGIGVIAMILRIVKLFIDYDDYKEVHEYLIKQKLGTSLIVFGGVFLFIGIFSTFFLILSFILMIGGVFIRDSETGFEEWIE